MSKQITLRYACLITGGLFLAGCFIPAGQKTLTAISLWLILPGMFVVLPVLAARYARELEESAVPWVVGSMFIPVIIPLLMSFKRVPAPPAPLAAATMIGGRTASSYGLGDPVARFPLNTRSFRVSGVKWLLGALLALFLLPLVMMAVEGATRGGPVLVPMIVMAGLSTACIFGIRQAGRSQDYCVVQFANGLTRTEKGATEAVRWDDVTAVWQDLLDQYVNGIHSAARRLYTVQLRDGRKIKFDERLKDIEQLGTAIQAEVGGRLLPALAARIEANETLAFGEVKVSKQGISVESAGLNWGEAAGAEISLGYLCITRSSGPGLAASAQKTAEAIAAFATIIVGTSQPMPSAGNAVTWKKIKAAKVPNVYPLIALIRQYAGNRS